MSFSHHAGEPARPNPEIEKIMQRLSDQIDGKAKRAYPSGRIAADDDGELALAVAADHSKGVVMLSFGKPVTWIGLPASEVRQLCGMLMAKCRELELTTHARATTPETPEPVCAS
jgi:hypothetical protein